MQLLNKRSFARALCLKFRHLRKAVFTTPLRRSLFFTPGLNARVFLKSIAIFKKHHIFNKGKKMDSTQSQAKQHNIYYRDVVVQYLTKLKGIATNLLVFQFVYAIKKGTHTVSPNIIPFNKRYTTYIKPNIFPQVGIFGGV